MTEQEWLACADPRAMLEFLRGKASDRKLRFFACACCRLIWRLLTDERSRQAVLVAERLADGQATLDMLIATHADAGEASQLAYTLALVDDTNEYPSSAARFASDDLSDVDMHHAASVCAADAAWATSVAIDVKGYRGPNPYVASRKAQAALLHDIFGNPFSSVSVHASWQTRTVVGLAQAIYDERAFDRLPILADALEESGCANADILNHCREPGPHVRGCWVVDLLLGKE
jgi:hypothetical protein